MPAPSPPSTSHLAANRGSPYRIDIPLLFHRLFFVWPGCSSAALLRESPGGSHPHYLGLRNFRMNWSVCPRIVWSNTLAVRGSAGLARIELSESNLNPAASTSRRTVEDSMRCKVSVTFAGAPRAAE